MWLNREIVINAYSVPLRDVEGNVVSALQFDSLLLDARLVEGFRRAFIAAFGHTSNSSQRQSFACIRKFALYLHEIGAANTVPLPRTVAIGLRDWLATSGLATSTAQSILNSSLTILAYCERNVPHLLSRETRLVVQRFMPEPPQHRGAVSDDQLKAILRCCHKDIESIEQRLADGQRSVVDHAESSAELEQQKLLRSLLALGKGALPSQQEILAEGVGLLRRVRAAGGLRSISRRLWICPEDILPFYVAIIIQTSGNPASILAIKRDCVVAHPLRDDLERVVWEKPRSHREQRMEAPVGRPWSAPNLVRRLIRINENLVARCSKKDRESLFIANRATLGRTPGVPAISLLHLLLKEFIDRHALPSFSFSSLRSAGATAHYRATGRMKDAQKRLNHRAASTSFRYANPVSQRDQHDLVIQRFQGLMVRASMTTDPTVGTQAKCPPSFVEAGADTVFGFRCRDPLGGIAEGSSVGSLCLQFQKCATCPGALIPLDNVTVVARLFATYHALVDARENAVEEGWMPRFKLLYEPTMRILADEILPAVSDGVRAKALAVAETRLIPKLE